MRPDDVAPSQQDHLVRAEGGYWAFMPPALPPPLDFGLDLVTQLSAADWALGTLAGAGHTMPNPHLLSQSLLRREAVLSSRIEGTQASLSELVIYEAEAPRGEGQGDVREVFNYVCCKPCAQPQAQIAAEPVAAAGGPRDPVDRRSWWVCDSRGVSPKPKLDRPARMQAQRGNLRAATPGTTLGNP